MLQYFAYMYTCRSFHLAYANSTLLLEPSRFDSTYCVCLVDPTLETNRKNRHLYIKSSKVRRIRINFTFSQIPFPFYKKNETNKFAKVNGVHSFSDATFEDQNECFREGTFSRCMHSVALATLSARPKNRPGGNTDITSGGKHFHSGFFYGKQGFVQKLAQKESS